MAKEEPKIVNKDKKIYLYWMGRIGRAKKAQPKDKWEAVQNRYAVKTRQDNERPFVNDCRKQHEAIMSFLDQQDASFKITPSEAFVNDIDAGKRAECDAAYLKRVWNEQKCQKVESRKLNDAVLRNNGFTLVQFDLKKWMPTLRYLPPTRVLIDSHCGGIEEEANWEGYWEDITFEQFRAWHPELSDTEFIAIAKKAGSVLEEKERDGLDEDDLNLYRTVRVYHIFARNSAAIREPEKTEEEIVPDKKLAEELQLETPRRYMQLVAGHHKLLVDEEAWPFDLDHDEYPLSHLQFNQVSESLYGFTDYQQMERMDELGDDIMRDLGLASFWAAVTKFLGSKTMPVDKNELNEFLNSAKTAYLPNMLDQDGKPKMLPVERGKINPGQMQLYELVEKATKEASTLSEVLSNADAQTFKDVTALAARISDENMHQRVNRRLGGPWGYEQSIAEDAIKMLEVAHQMVPKLSAVSVMEQVPVNGLANEDGLPVTEEQEVVKDLSWNEALAAIKNGGTLIKLGVDAIVGAELAEYWPYKMPSEQWRLNIKVVVEPGTTRSVTRQQQAAVMKQLYLEMFFPFYMELAKLEPTAGFKYARDFLEFVGRLAQIPNIESKLPDMEEIQQIVEQFKQQQQQQMQQEQQQQAEMQQQSEQEMQIKQAESEMDLNFKAGEMGLKKEEMEMKVDAEREKLKIDMARARQKPKESKND